MVLRHICFGMRRIRKSKFWKGKRPTSLGYLFLFLMFFCLSFFSFSAVIELLLGLFPVQKLPRKHHRDGQSLPWSGRKCCEVFGSHFWAFSCIFQGPSSRSFWSGYHWKDLFLLQKLGIDDANFGQRWGRQKQNKGQGSSRAITGGAEVNGWKGHLNRESPRSKAYLNSKEGFLPSVARTVRSASGGHGLTQCLPTLCRPSS